MMLASDHRLRDVGLTADLDFEDTGEKKVVTVENRTAHKCMAVWMVPGETRMPTNVDLNGDVCDRLVEHAQFRVSPTVWELPPGSSAEFQVSFHPQEQNHTDATLLECLVFPKKQRSYRLADSQLVPPSLVGTMCY